MANQQIRPHFDAAMIQKRKKSKGVKVPGGDEATSSEGSGSLACETFTPSSSTKHLQSEGGSVAEETEPEVVLILDSPGILETTLPLIGNFTHPPPPPSLVSSVDPNPLLKDASHFIMEFDGYTGTPVTSIYDWCFLNEVFIDGNLTTSTDKEKYQKVELLGLLHA